jgi:hypothetical protein
MLDLGVMNEKNKGVLTSLLGYFGYMPGEKANVGEGELKAFAEAWKYSYLRDVNPPNKVTVRAPDFTQSPLSKKFIKNSVIECADAGGVLAAVAISSGKLGHAEIAKDALIEASKSAPDKFTASWSLSSLGKLVAAFPELDADRKVTNYLKACANPGMSPISAIVNWFQGKSDRVSRIQYSANTGMKAIRQAHPERTDLPEPQKTESDPSQYINMVMNDGLKKKFPRLHQSICEANPALSHQIQLEAVALAAAASNAKAAPGPNTVQRADAPTLVARAIFEKLAGRTATM